MKRTAKNVRAIAFRFSNNPPEFEVIELVRSRLQRIEQSVEITLSKLDDSYYAEVFPTVRSQCRALGILRGFVQIDHHSIKVMTIEQVNEIFNAHRRMQERSLFSLPH